MVVYRKESDMLDKVENPLQVTDFDASLICLACGEIVEAMSCEVTEDGYILCPNCGKDICNYT